MTVVDGRQIRLMRVSREITQEALGDAVGLRGDYICKIEKGHHPGGKKSLEKILEILLSPEEEE